MADHRFVPYELERLPPERMRERAYIVFPIGYPAGGARVPDLRRKPLEEVLIERP